MSEQPEQPMIFLTQVHGAHEKNIVFSADKYGKEWEPKKLFVMKKEDALLMLKDIKLNDPSEKYGDLTCKKKEGSTKNEYILQCSETNDTMTLTPAMASVMLPLCTCLKKYTFYCDLKSLLYPE